MAQYEIDPNEPMGYSGWLYVALIASIILYFVV